MPRSRGRLEASRRLLGLGLEAVASQPINEGGPSPQAATCQEPQACVNFYVGILHSVAE